MLDTSEPHFDINNVLTDLFMVLRKSSKDIELIYDMDMHIPKELRGNDKALLTLLTTILTFVFNFSDEKEIILSLTAPEDFLYEEDISFKIETTNIGKEKILAFLETELGKALKILHGKIVYDNSDIHLSIPFTISELGFRRHYRLPNKSMLGKKILLIIESEKLTFCIAKMFKYFSYDVDTRTQIEAIEINDIARYDIVVIEDVLVTEKLSSMAVKIQQKKNLKCVLLENIHSLGKKPSYALSTHLIKPATQESIFALVVSLFDNNKFDTEIKAGNIEKLIEVDNAIAKATTKSTIDTKHNKDSLHTVIEDKKRKVVLTLDKELGKQNTAKMNLVYATELENFLDKFDRSDLYFRQIVNEKSVHKIKEFCIDLEKYSKIIGAESMLKFSDIISLIFVYDKLDMLPIYPGKYHIELGKLMNEIKTYLGK